MTDAPSDGIEADAEPGEREVRLAERVYLGILIVLQLAMAAELVLLIIDEQWLNAALAFGVIILTLLPLTLASRLHVRIPAELQLLTVMFVFASLFLGETLSYYERFAWWDTALHFSSGLLLGVFGFLLVYVLNEHERVAMRLHPFFVALFAFVFAVAMGGLWEIFEFTMDLVFGLGMQKNGLPDTMWDLTFATISAAIVSAAGWWYLSRHQRPYIERWISRFIERNPRLFRRR